MRFLVLFFLLVSTVSCGVNTTVEMPEVEYGFSHICEFEEGLRYAIYKPSEVIGDPFMFHPQMKYDGKNRGLYLFRKGQEKIYQSGDEVSLIEASIELTPAQFSMCFQEVSYQYKSTLVYKTRLANGDVYEIYDLFYEADSEHLSPYLDLGDYTIWNSGSFYVYHNDSLIELEELLLNEDIPLVIWEGMISSLGDNVQWE